MPHLSAALLCNLLGQRWGHSSFKWTAAWPILQPPHLLSCFSCWWGIWISPSSPMAGPYSDTLSVSSEIHGSLSGAEILYFRKTCALLKVLGCPQHPLLSRSKFCSIWRICLVAFGWEHFLFHQERSFYLLFLLPSVDFKRNNSVNALAWYFYLIKKIFLTFYQKSLLWHHGCVELHGTN